MQADPCIAGQEAQGHIDTFADLVAWGATNGGGDSVGRVSGSGDGGNASVLLPSMLIAAYQMAT